ncbi:hypothetical protein [Rhodoplanes sp. SY1]|uniref:hypothetical protein n=1 Tax=Rhodoplanes sp. SY1 TaxID=3166646 RepID=UPI0038B4793D
MVRSSAIVAGTAKRLWPRNTAAHLAAAAGVHPRTAELWLAGESPSFEAFWALLWSEQGDAFYEAGMNAAPHPPLHWIVHRREKRIGRARERVILAKRELERLERGDEP